MQFRIVRPDGSIVHLDSLAMVVTDSRTSHRRLVGITLDISERVAAEQRERLLQKQLREASHQSGMAEVATGVLHNVGNVLNSLGVASLDCAGATQGIADSIEWRRSRPCSMRTGRLGGIPDQ